MKIRKMCKEDIDWVHDLGCKTPELWDSNTERFPSKKILVKLIKSRRFKCFVAEDATPVGFVFVELEPELESAYVYYLAVKSEFRGKGIGTRLAKYAMDSAKRSGMRYFSIFAKTNNKRAIKLYERMGFKKGYVMQYMSK